MFLRFAAAFAVSAMGFLSLSASAAAQGYPYFRPFSPVEAVPEAEETDESVVMIPGAPGLPYPAGRDRYVPQAQASSIRSRRNLRPTAICRAARRRSSATNSRRQARRLSRAIRR